MDNAAQILVVDDNHLLRAATLRVLQQAHYKVAEAATGSDALRLVQQQPPDLILLDIVLPDMDGRDVCQHIKADPELAGTFVILFSSLKIAPNDRVEGLGIGADGYITRPIGNAELVARVQAMLRIKRAEDALRRRSQELQDRVNELNCLYDISTLVEQPGISLDEILKDVADLVAVAGMHPEIAGCQIVLDDQEFQSENFRSTAWSQDAAIVVQGEQRGSVRACYLEARPERAEAPSASDDGKLLKAIAKRLGRAIEQIWAEKALKESEARHRSLLEDTPLGLYSSTPDGQLLAANAAMVDMLAYPDRESLLQVNAVDLYVDPRERPQWLATLDQRDRLAHEVEIQLRRLDGQSIWVQDTARAVRDDLGRVVRYDGALQDITQRKQAEQSLRESQALLAESQAIAHVGSWELDLVANRLTWSDEAYRIFGLRSQEFDATYEAFLEAVHPDDHDAVVTAYSGSVVEGRDGYEIEHRIVRRNSGEVRVVQERCEHIKDASGQVIRSVGMVQDITERKQMEDALRESEAMFRAQYEAIPLPTYTWQKDGDDAVLIDYNTAALATTQGTVHDFLGIEASKLYRDRPDIVEDLRQCLARECPLEREMTYRFRATGKVRDMVARYAYVPPDLILVHTEDITERKQAQQRLEASLQEKTVLLQEIHHRVKNNMQVISSLLDMQAMQSPDPEVRQALQDSKNRIRAMAFVHDRLYQSPDLARVDLGNYLEGLARYLFAVSTPQATEVDLHVEIEDLSLGLDEAIPCGLIINELVSNALKYAFPPDETDGGEIRIEVRPRQDGQLVLTVGDNGVGLPPEVDPWTSPSLGLRLVGMLTQQLGGTLELDRRAGTVFRITFADPNHRPSGEADR
jgi:PAS domain S-box-containing protein